MSRRFDHQRMQWLREQRAMSLATLAGLVEVKERTVETWEAGQKVPGALHLLKLAEVLEVDPRELVTGVAT
jgi:DNA-binding transcriptional regulator YiaG